MDKGPLNRQPCSEPCGVPIFHRVPKLARTVALGLLPNNFSFCRYRWSGLCQGSWFLPLELSQGTHSFPS